MVVALVLGLALALIATSASCSDDDYPGLHVADNRLVDREGGTVRLLGVNRSGGEYACVGGHGFFAGPTGRRAVAAMKAWRINAVRVPLNEHCWLGINGAPTEYSRARYRKAVRGYVARLHRAGLYVVLDLHWSAPGDAQAGRQQPMADLDHAPAFWSSVARAFKHDPALVFDLGMLARRLHAARRLARRRHAGTRRCGSLERRPPTDHRFGHTLGDRPLVVARLPA
jgi:hypothetical protein